MNSFIYMLYPKRYINSLEKKFKRLGSSNKIDINIFLITRLILEFILFILLLLIPVYGLILSILFTVLFHFLYEDLILNNRLIKREKIILDSLREVLELYLLGIKYNQDNYLVFKRVVGELDNDLTEEIKYLMKRYNSFEEVLSNLVTMIPEYEFSDDILMLSGKETSKYVNKILENIDGIDKANQNRIVSMIPVKIISISILFLCLVLLIILLGPNFL